MQKKKKQASSTFEFGTTPQSLLFGYLKPAQQEAVKPLMRVLKKRAQRELCYALLDYMELGMVDLPADLTLATLYLYLTQVDQDAKTRKPVIRPLFSNNPFIQIKL